MLSTRLNEYRNREEGFTLIELLIVVLIIGILAAIAIPVYLGIQTQARHASVKSDVVVSVHNVQVSLTEGQTLNTAATANTDSSPRSDKNTVTTVAYPTNRFTVTGVGQDGYTYVYDSDTGKYTESATAPTGGATTSPATAAPVLSVTYANVYQVDTNNGTTFGTKGVNYTKLATNTSSCSAYNFTNGTDKYIKFAATGGGVTYTITNFENAQYVDPSTVSIDPSTGYLTGNVSGFGEFGVTVKATNTLGSTSISHWVFNDAC